MGWATESDADTYLALKPGTDSWFETGADNAKYLETAYRSIYYNPDYTIPTSPDADELTRLKYAQIELAWFIKGEPDFERRTFLINQGVSSFQFSQWSESYASSSITKDKMRTGNTIYPPQVVSYLASFKSENNFTVNVTRKLERYL